MELTLKTVATVKTLMRAAASNGMGFEMDEEGRVTLAYGTLTVGPMDQKRALTYIMGFQDGATVQAIVGGMDTPESSEPEPEPEYESRPEPPAGVGTPKPDGID